MAKNCKHSGSISRYAVILIFAAGASAVAKEVPADAAPVIPPAVQKVITTETQVRTQILADIMEQKKNAEKMVDRREYPEADFLKLLVLDATTGQNAVNQARVFDEAVELDGIVLTKLDGTAKGGFVFSLSAELGLPVLYAGVGEKMDDLEMFDAETFVEAIL